MPFHDLLLIGASAGGVEALIKLVQDLPANLQAAIVIVVHFPVHSTSALPNILQRVGKIPAKHAKNEETILPGHIYVAPPDRHIVLNDGKVKLVYGPRVNGVRPAIDPLFQSAAREYGSRVIGVILSGMLDDGTAGLLDIKNKGGVTIVQDPDEAIFSSMPNNAIESHAVDYVLPLSQMAATLTNLVSEPVAGGEKAMVDQTQKDQIPDEERILAQDIHAYQVDEQGITRTIITCPECGGLIWELHEGQLTRYRCHVGHVYSQDSFIIEKSKALEAALWTAIRSVEERAILLRRLSTQAESRSNGEMKSRLLEMADEMEQHANAIRQVLNNVDK